MAIVLPNSLDFDDSAVVLDLKLKNHKLTSLFRQRHGHDAFLFAPFSDMESPRMQCVGADVKLTQTADFNWSISRPLKP